MIFTIIKFIIWYILYTQYIENTILYLLVTLYFIINKLGVLVKENNDHYNDYYNNYYNDYYNDYNLYYDL